jgi:hypothetical protein
MCSKEDPLHTGSSTRLKGKVFQGFIFFRRLPWKFFFFSVKLRCIPSFLVKLRCIPNKKLGLQVATRLLKGKVLQGFIFFHADSIDFFFWNGDRVQTQYDIDLSQPRMRCGCCQIVVFVRFLKSLDEVLLDALCRQLALPESCPERRHIHATVIMNSRLGTLCCRVVSRGERAPASLGLHLSRRPCCLCYLRFP